MDNDGCLNIINLLNLYKHFEFFSRIGQETFRCIDYYMQKVIWTKSVVGRVEITQEVFSKIMDNRSCVRDEIRKLLLGIKTLDVRDRHLENYFPKSVLTKMEPQALKKIVPYAELDEKVGQEGRI